MFEDFQQRIRITRRSSDAHDLIVGFVHYFPLSFLPDEFWTAMAISPFFRVTDGSLTELPIQVFDLDVVNKKGALWIRDNKSSGKKAYWLHYASPTANSFDAFGSFGGPAVWSDYDDVIPLNENPDNVFFFNLRSLGLSGTFQSNTGNHSGIWIDSKLEQKANRFFNSKDNRVDFSFNTMNTFTTPKTFFFLWMPTKIPTGAPGNGTQHLFGFFNGESTPYRFVFTPGQTIGMETPGFQYNGTQGGEVNVNTGQWYLFAMKFEEGVGLVEIDIDGEAKTLFNPDGVWPAVQAGNARTVGGTGTDGSDQGLSMFMVYDGSLAKAQRDQWFRNWFQPEDFWRVLTERGSQVCFDSLMEKNLCFSSHIKG